MSHLRDHVSRAFEDARLTPEQLGYGLCTSCGRPTGLSRGFGKCAECWRRLVEERDRPSKRDADNSKA